MKLSESRVKSLTKIIMYKLKTKNEKEFLKELGYIFGNELNIQKLEMIIDFELSSSDKMHSAVLELLNS